MLAQVIMVLCSITCIHVADMSGTTLLDPRVDSKHRGAHLEGNPGSLTPLVTRVANANWQIHDGWIDRYSLLLPFLLFIFYYCETMLLWAYGMWVLRVQAG